MRTLSGLLALLVLVFAGCATDSTSGATTSVDAAGSGGAADLDFTATTLDGKTFEGASLEGTPTVLWFWAPWCATCRAQMETVSDVGGEYAGRVNVIGVGGLDSASEIEDLAGQIGDVTHLVDDEGSVWRHFSVTEQSSYTVIDAGGEIVHEGFLDNDALEDLVADLVA